jgi:hypothetical protein
VNGKVWEIVKRYKEFEALRNFFMIQNLTTKISSINETFPTKSFWRVTGNGLERRRVILERYLGALLEASVEGPINTVDALASFLEVGYPCSAFKHCLYKYCLFKYYVNRSRNMLRETCRPSKALLRP